MNWHRTSDTGAVRRPRRHTERPDVTVTAAPREYERITPKINEGDSVSPDDMGRWALAEMLS